MDFAPAPQEFSPVLPLPVDELGTRMRAAEDAQAPRHFMDAALHALRLAAKQNDRS
ncbi:MAG: hypothetical protein HKUEN07_07340 [Rhodocyclaceae bacterium]|nr:MAG: hypothetical protein HKUEN07_07340 [Rhodocyclaceae bacterium]